MRGRRRGFRRKGRKGFWFRAASSTSAVGDLVNALIFAPENLSGDDQQIDKRWTLDATRITVVPDLEVSTVTVPGLHSYRFGLYVADVSDNLPRDPRMVSSFDQTTDWLAIWDSDPIVVSSGDVVAIPLFEQGAQQHFKSRRSFPSDKGLWLSAASVPHGNTTILTNIFIMDWLYSLRVRSLTPT